mmetsp:Transcript_12217/g.17685  ORF Transcript_12217/g.17685 Transcript_12217/m.17685 type:complete len:179 (+) Transcript_12217:18-554(+)|eukprot:CAMPEP_0195529900 /NCGR_PEP_ID=MMETSP0794_2-20130614/32554_1 /TAXON_ID=515487 /ORGANISM="Stephanopyxis turris, Strain CCMP 815" /LENGTH=178 /DNA_ID=CAMNT_0040661277 /DNA_START=18 /DNA_END=554 /DNA_ORIENTATION=+
MKNSTIRFLRSFLLLLGSSLCKRAYAGLRGAKTLNNYDSAPLNQLETNLKENSTLTTDEDDEYEDSNQTQTHIIWAELTDEIYSDKTIQQVTRLEADTAMSAPINYSSDGVATLESAKNETHIVDDGLPRHADATEHFLDEVKNIIGVSSFGLADDIPTDARVLTRKEMRRKYGILSS